MLEKRKKALDNKEVSGALLTDLLKAFDCFNHELLIPKLHAYDLSLPSLKLADDYLLNCKQRTKVNSKYSAWGDILEGVPQGPTLRSLLFIIFLCADDNTSYVIKNTIEQV